MSNIYTGVRRLVGGTPLVEFSRLAQTQNLGARLIGKLEMFNPGGSVKDRIAQALSLIHIWPAASYTRRV